jgi:DNA-binding NarL/FixJ family response regulator
MSGGKVRAFICEHSELVRNGIACALQQSGDIEIVGSASDALSALEEIGRLMPDVVVMDVLAPQVDGIEATKRVKSAHPDIPILVLTSTADDDILFGALSSGADGYCLQQSPLPNIVQAVVVTASGATWLDPSIAMKVLRNCSRPGTCTHQTITKSGLPDNKFRLSVREMDVLEHLVEGLSNREIAGRMCVSADTVKTHARHIMEKLMVSDRTQAAVKALREGLVVAKVR